MRDTARDTEGTPALKKPGTVLGRSSAEMISALKLLISSGQAEAGSFLPTVRQLSQQYAVSRGTAWRALKALSAEGLVVARPRHGYRVMARANRPETGAPIVYVLSQDNIMGGWDTYYSHLFNALEGVACSKGSKIMKVLFSPGSEEELLAQISRARPWGLILDTSDPQLLRRIASSGIPGVIVDAWCPDIDLDAVVQDDFQGGRLAAKHLHEIGCQRIAWLGPVAASDHGQPRFGGAASFLEEQGSSFSHVAQTSLQGSDIEKQAREILDSSDRPDGIICLWRTVLAGVTKVASSLEIDIGDTLKIVGWIADEVAQEGFLAYFPAGQTAPRITWSIARMAETAICRLFERRNNPGVQAMKITIPTFLHNNWSEKLQENKNENKSVASEC
jgi:DNA-binding LacI/PurR family transcriptional regulator